MKNDTIKYNKVEYEKIPNINNKNKIFINFKILYYIKELIILFIILLILIYLFIENNNNKNKIKDLLNYKKENLIKEKDNIQLIKELSFKEKNLSSKFNIIEKELKILKKEILNIKLIIHDNKFKNNFLYKEENNNTESKFNTNIDEDLIGIKYPQILFDNIKSNLFKKNLISSLFEFMEQLEVKLIYLEKEINVTKLHSFYTARKLYLEKKQIEYDDSNLTELHNIVSWLVIHKSTQLKGIASDKYLACKYVTMKLGENLCEHRIAVYNNFEEINYEEIIKLGNVILKVSNGCGDNIFIFRNNTEDIMAIKAKMKKSFERNYGLIVPEFFHSYSKKRIVLEKMFFPLTDLYEFKFVIINCDIKIIYIRTTRNDKIHIFYYDSKFRLLIGEKNYTLDISMFKNDLLDKLKNYAIKLSEDFPNFIRVDLYLFHDKIYLSELTFDSQDGFPFMRDYEIIKNASKNWKRIE